MEIKSAFDSNTEILEISGRINTNTAPQFETEIENIPDFVTRLIIDFKDVAYLSSAGLRVILLAQQTMAERDGMMIKNVSEPIMEIFEITGFSDILTFE